MAGYFNYSMSNNAIEAYQSGEKPLSKWTKSDILQGIKILIKNELRQVNFDFDLLKKVKLSDLKRYILKYASWHHTSCKYNCTEFYEIDIEYLEKLTNEIIKSWLEYKEEKTTPKVQKAKCEFLIWEGTKKHPKAKKYIEIGEIVGNWFYSTFGKKSITANGFCILERL